MGAQRAFQVVLVVKNPPPNAGDSGDMGSVSPWVWKIRVSRKWYPNPVFLLENPMDRGTWRTTIHGATESDMTGQLSTREHRGVNENMDKRKAYQRGKIKHSYINNCIKCK